MKTKKLLKLICSVSITTSFLISNLAFADAPEMYKIVKDNLPAIGVSTTIYLGDRLLVQRLGMWADCITPKSEFAKSYNLGLRLFIVKKDIPICKSANGSDKYIPNYANDIGASNQFPSFTYPIAIRKKGDGIKICEISMGLDVNCSGELPSSSVLSLPTFLTEESSLQQTIEYSGKSGNILKFIYAEYKDDYARQAFNREFTVDLTEGNIVAYKGAIIEVEKATNAEITYKVIRNFQQ